MQSIICDNYEISLGEAGVVPVLTFDVDDIGHDDLKFISNATLRADGLAIDLAAEEGQPGQIQVLFPYHNDEKISELFREIQASPGKLMFIALGGDPNQPDQTIVAYGNELPLLSA